MDPSPAGGGGGAAPVEAGDHSSISILKRRHPSMAPFRPPPQPPKLSPSETIFRLICPAAASGRIIGKGGAVVRQIRDETSAFIRVEDPPPGSDDCVVLVVGDYHPKTLLESNGEEASPAQKALIRVFERVLRGEKSGEGSGEEEESSVVCRLLAPSGQVGCVIGKGGKIVEKIKMETGTQIRVLGHGQVPPCVAAGDELIQISGSFSAVKKALIAVSSCLQDNPRVEIPNSSSSNLPGATFHGTGPHGPGDPYVPSPRGYVSGMHGPDYPFRGIPPHPGMDSPISRNRKVFEEEVVFRMLCANDKVGFFIGKAGAVVRALQSETGASIRVAEPVSDSDERVIMISAREHTELRHSPAQDAVLHVFARLAEADVGITAPSARLLVPAQQIGCLLGKGGAIISEMRRATGANIKIFLKEQVPRCAQPNDEVVQVTGNFQSINDALLHITGRIRETIFPLMPHPNVSMTQYPSSAPEIPPHRPRNDSLGPYSGMGRPHGPDRSVGFPHGMERPTVPAHGMDHFGPMGTDRVPFSYAVETAGHRPVFDRPPSPGSWASPAISNVTPRGIPDSGTGLGFRNAPMGSGSQTAFISNATVKVVVPQHLLQFVCGENESNLAEIREISGAKVMINDMESGATEGTIIISGIPNQTRAAQTLLHAFILCGKTAQ